MEILAEKGGTLRLENPFRDGAYNVTGARAEDIKADVADLVIKTSRDQKISLTRK